MLPDVLTFEDTELEVIDRDGQVWLSGLQIGDALGYSDDKAVSHIYARNFDEFTDEMTCVVKLTTQGQIRDVRVFSLRGAHLLGMFARTERAKAFRRWVLDVLEGIADAPVEMPVPGLPASVNHRADHIVSASRSFSGLMRAAQALRLGHAQAARCANQATLRRTGVNLLAELGVTDEDLRQAEPPAPRRSAARSASSYQDSLEDQIALWLDAPEQADANTFTSQAILFGALGLPPKHKDIRSMQTRLGLIMGKLGWTRTRPGIGVDRLNLYVRPE